MSLKLVRIARLKQLQAELNVRGPMALGAAIGRKTNQTSDLLAGRAAFGEKLARSIEEVAALPSGWLDMPFDRREGRDVSSSGAALAPGPVSIQVPGLAGAEGMRADVHAAVVGSLLLSPRWVNRFVELVGGPKDLRFLHAVDDSMEPTIGRGDLLLIDSGVTRCDMDGVYALRARSGVAVKRIRLRRDSAFDVSSDSPTVKTVDVLTAAQLQLLGRVVWIWRGRPA